MLLTLAAAAAAAPEPAGAQATPRPDSTTRAGRRMSDPLERLLGRRDDLRLSQEQVQRLESIRTRYREKNGPLIEQARKAWVDRDPSAPGMGPRERRHERREYLSQHPELASAIKQLRANRKAAWEEAMGILDSSQKDRIKQLRREEWGRERGRVRRSQASG